MLPPLFCVPLFSYHLHTYHCYRFQVALLDRSSHRVGHSLLRPLPSPLVSDVLYCTCLYSQFSRNFQRIPATGLPFMSIPLSLFLTFLYTDHTHYFQDFPSKASWIANPHTPVLCYIFTSLSTCYYTTLTAFQLPFPNVPIHPF